MDFKVWSFCKGCFFFAFFSFLAVHFSYMKQPPQDRFIASATQYEKPWYDASWKM